ncbi:hypothetical protein LTR10_021194 [Elasticomyces elasticus]|nr:hypothetical protein LTR10_021194 [Elasticomyces elasticus]
MVKSLLDVDLGGHEGPDGAAHDGWHLRVFSCVKALRLDRIDRNRKLLELKRCERGVVLTVTAGRPNKTISSLSRVNRSLLRGYITPTSLEGKPTTAQKSIELRGIEVNQNEADFSLIRSWLDEDILDVGNSKSSFRCQVIDCDNLEIVQHDPTVRYLALSYVWGQSGDSNNLEMTLLANAPQTVKDAIRVTKQLGERYLWVDRYCIPDQKEDLHIANMDLIYAGAFATIVAANPGAMDSAHSGLYGISRPRNPQPNFRYNGRTFVSSLPHVTYQIAKSKWATRGWTYQEAVLSSRCLFFTPDQVYYASTKTLQCESVLRSGENRRHGTLQTLGPSLMKLEEQLECTTGHKRRADAALVNGHKRRPDDGYALHLSEFMRRDLTYELDKLDAFRGVLRRISETSLYGVPIPEYRTFVAFTANLCWTSDLNARETLARRTCFPSWSWASVSKVDQICPRWVASENHAGYGIEHTDGLVVSLPHIVGIYMEERQPIPEMTPFLHVTNFLFTVQLEWNEDAKDWMAKCLIGLAGMANRFEYNLDDSKVYIDSRESHSMMLQQIGMIHVPALLLGAYSAEGRHFVKYFLLLEKETSSQERRMGLLEVRGRLAGQVDWYNALRTMHKQTIRLG